jgi:hypothetical protein
VPNPETKYASAIPGKTACEIASPIMAILRKIKKLPSIPLDAANNVPVNMIQKAAIRF